MNKLDRAYMLVASLTNTLSDKNKCYGISGYQDPFYYGSDEEFIDRRRGDVDRKLREGVMFAKLAINNSTSHSDSESHSVSSFSGDINGIPISGVTKTETNGKIRTVTANGNVITSRFHVFEFEPDITKPSPNVEKGVRRLAEIALRLFDKHDMWFYIIDRDADYYDARGHIRTLAESSLSSYQKWDESLHDLPDFVCAMTEKQQRIMVRDKLGIMAKKCDIHAIMPFNDDDKIFSNQCFKDYANEFYGRFDNA